MSSCQVEGELKVGGRIRLDGQALQGVQPLLDLLHGKTPVSYSREQGVARLQVPELRCQCPVLHESVQYSVRTRLVLIVEEPRHYYRGIDHQSAHRR